MRRHGTLRTGGLLCAHVFGCGLVLWWDTFFDSFSLSAQSRAVPDQRHDGDRGQGAL